MKILIASSFRPKKGILSAIEAIARFAAETHTGVSVGIIGDGATDLQGRREKEKITALLESTGLGKDTTLYGFCTFSRLLEIALDYHVFMHPSNVSADGDDEGGAPVVLFEMMASGMPVVSTLHCDIPDTITDGVTGYLAPERDVGGLAACLGKLRDNPGAWGSLTSSARACVETSHDLEKQAAALEKIYFSLIQ